MLEPSARNMAMTVLMAGVLLGAASPTHAQQAEQKQQTTEPSTDMSNDTEVLRYEKQFKTVLGKQMAYIDIGAGDPIVFLHASSYLWRNVMPHLEGRGRLVAIDMIGMGSSDKLDNTGDDSYSLAENTQYTAALLEALGIDDNVTLVLHDWGSGVGFNWANQNRDAVKAIAFMEAIVTPFPSWDEFPKELHGPMHVSLSRRRENGIGRQFFHRNIVAQRYPAGSERSGACRIPPTLSGSG